MSNRELKTITLSDSTQVDVVTNLTWGEQEDLRAIFLNSAKLQNSASGNETKVDYSGGVLTDVRYKLLELAIKEIRIGENKQQYTKEWMRDLSAEDGDLIFSAVEELNKKKV
ncbi:MAG: hypothetical protein NTZ18_03650 [Candidatus Komeilibacteria bacterium]|nr:hypothetical protein [Candidatus Komeilibacteria bacterium]